MKLQTETINRYLTFPLVKALLGFVVIIVAYKVFVAQDVGELIFVSSIGLAYTSLFYIVPITVLYYTHKRSSKGKDFVYEGVGRWKLLFEDKEYRENEVESVDRYLTPSKAAARLDWSLWGHYNYYVFNLMDGDRIVLSCLVTDQIREIKSIKHNSKKQFFPIPKRDRI